MENIHITLTCPCLEYAYPMLYEVLAGALANELRYIRFFLFFSPFFIAFILLIYLVILRF